MQKLLPILVVFFLALPALAQVPRTISFQGVLTDPSGALVPDGNHSLKLQLYDNATASIPIWAETQNVVVVRGVFNAILGSNAPFPSNLSFDRAYFLGVSVDGASELSPRTALTSVPYALRAATADALAPGASGVVTSVNGMDGAVTLQGGGGTTVTQNGGAIIISSSGGGGGGGIAGVQSTDGSISITDPNGPVANLRLADNAVTASKLAPGVLPTSLPPSGNAGGDLSGTYPNPTIANGVVTAAKLSPAGATNGQALVFNGTNVAWGTLPAGFALPYRGVAPADNQPLVHLENTGTSASSTYRSVLRLRGSTGTGLHVDTAGVALLVDTAFVGLRMRGTDFGIHLGAARYNGITIDSAGQYGIVVYNAYQAGVAAISVGPTGVGVSGVHANTVGTAAGVSGISASTANGTSVSSGASGVIGTISSTSAGSLSAGVRGVNNSTGPGSGGVIGYQAGSGWGVHGTNPNGAGVYAVSTGGGSALIANHTGNAGNIALFQVNNGNVARIDRTGKGYFNGGTQTGGADLAEAFAVDGDRTSYEPGDVLVISTASDRTVTKSSEPYSTAVVGVYATKPGMLLTERDVEADHSDMVPMGVVGVIPTKVTGENGAIRRGDLLVTSSTSGHAMKAGANPPTGTVIGKALENFDGTTGVIRVMVNVK